MITSPPPMLDRLLRHEAIDAELAALYERICPSVTQVSGGNGNGAGTIWRSDGMIVTNDHVVGRAERLHITLPDGRNLEGGVAARDSELDLALVEIDLTDLPVPTIGDSSRLRAGQLVLSIGHPHGQMNTLTAGIVVCGRNGAHAGPLVQSDAHIAPGSSGGPLVDVEGRVLGINTRVSGRLSMAIPSAAVERFVSGLIPARAHAWLGLNGVIATLPHGPQSTGFVVTEVLSSSPAAAAGLSIGDILLAIGGTPIVDRESLPAAMLRARPGEPIGIEATRGGRPFSLAIVPVELNQH